MTERRERRLINFLAAALIAGGVLTGFALAWTAVALGVALLLR